jgi:hypothetical protein
MLRSRTNVRDSVCGLSVRAVVKRGCGPLQAFDESLDEAVMADCGDEVERLIEY